MINAAPAHGKVNARCGATKSKSTMFVTEYSLVNALSAIVFLQQKLLRKDILTTLPAAHLFVIMVMEGLLKANVVEKLHWLRLTVQDMQKARSGGGRST